MLSKKSFPKLWKMVTLPTYSTTVKHLLVEKEGPITLFGINRPDVRNCVNVALANDIRQAIEDFENDDTQLAGVLHGVGGNFCAGYDLKELSNVGETTIPIKPDGTMGPTLRFIKKPIVAAVSGYAVAGGLELALMCDLRVVEESAVMGVFCRRFGVPLIDGGTVRLQATVGLSRALDLILTGRPVDAKEAFQMGLANRIVATGTGLGQAIQLASSLVKFPQACLLADRKSTYNAAFTSSYEKLLEWEQQNSTQVILQESVDGAKKFMSGIGRHGKTYNLTEKMIPDWEKDTLKKNKL